MCKLIGVHSNKERNKKKINANNPKTIIILLLIPWKNSKPKPFGPLSLPLRFANIQMLISKTLGIKILI
jgi:hypothetical protein